jgi:hypothetical protein
MKRVADRRPQRHGVYQYVSSARFVSPAHQSGSSTGDEGDEN